ncbi:MAG: type II toxin-antitoxin system VapC family toxin, partial [Clostridia bacterium]|nr:type II toxin-antitoxin system VapC family toxin [Clostridia bacterium]
MDRYVVDASVAVSLVLPDEPYHEVSTYLFERFARGELELVTVPLLNFEVANALWKAVRLGRTQISTAMEAMKQIE